MIDGLASAFAFATVAPVRCDVGPGRAAIVALPVVGSVLGLLSGGALWAGFWAFGPPSRLAGLSPAFTLPLAPPGPQAPPPGYRSQGLGPGDLGPQHAAGRGGNLAATGEHGGNPAGGHGDDDGGQPGHVRRQR